MFPLSFVVRHVITFGSSVVHYIPHILRKYFLFTMCFMVIGSFIIFLVHEGLFPLSVYSIVLSLRYCSPSLFYLLTVGVEVFDFHLITDTTFDRTPLDEGSARRRDLCLTTQTLTSNKHPCPCWDSNPRSQQALGRRCTP
jgi:hypothetical protein